MSPRGDGLGAWARTGQHLPSLPCTVSVMAKLALRSASRVPGVASGPMCSCWLGRVTGMVPGPVYPMLAGLGHRHVPRSDVSPTGWAEAHSISHWLHGARRQVSCDLLHDLVSKNQEGLQRLYRKRWAPEGSAICL